MGLTWSVSGSLSGSSLSGVIVDFIVGVRSLYPCVWGVLFGEMLRIMLVPCGVRIGTWSVFVQVPDEAMVPRRDSQCRGEMGCHVSRPRRYRVLVGVVPLRSLLGPPVSGSREVHVYPTVEPVQGGSDWRVEGRNGLWDM